jgi:protocatechuate 3,4-dioxygenase beta subunit
MLRTIAFLCCLFVVGHAPQNTGSISGRVTVQGKPLAGIVLGLQSQASATLLPLSNASRAESDTEGHYQFRGVAPGTYQITVLNPLYVLPVADRFAQAPSITITIAEDENITDAHVDLVRGGIVTGKVVGPEGRPLIEQYVQLDRLDARGNPNAVMPINRLPYDTDDRGIYRIIGVLPGRYRVSSGEGEGSVMRMPGRKSYPRTFHPDTTDVAQAKIIEVAEGSEVTGVDIQLSQPPKAFTIVGRVVDAETNEPVPNFSIIYSAARADGNFSGMGGTTMTNGNGDFRIEAVRQGRYGVYAGSRTLPQPSDSRYSDPVVVEVLDGDATGVEIRIKRGGTISGVVIVEGVTDPTILAGLSETRLMIYVDTPARTMMMTSYVKIASDGSFRFEGVRPGKARINPMPGPTAPPVKLIRIERDGVSVPGIDIGPGENVTGVRIVFAYGTGIVRGQVIVKGGNLPEGTNFFISAQRTDGSSGGASARSDLRGSFVLEKLPPGQYELVAQPSPSSNVPLPPELHRRFAAIRQSVTVANGQTVTVAFTVDLTQPEQKQ